MTPDAAEALLEALGGKCTGQTDTWMRGPCILAPWTHKNGKDSSPSFGLLIEEGSRPRFHCFTCESGSLSSLLQAIEFHDHKSPGRFHGNMEKAREIVEAAELELPMLPSYVEFGAAKKKVFEPLPGYVLSTFLPAAKNDRSYAYCKQRGFSNTEIATHDLRYDPERDMLLFPYWDVFDRLAGIRGRKITMKGEDKPVHGHHDYVFDKINNSGLTFYNEQALNLPGKVVVVEGQIDAIKVARIWPKTIGNLTAKPVMDKVTKLAQTEGVILLLDGDATGRLATEKWLHLLAFLDVPVRPLYLPWDVTTDLKTDPDSVGSEWLLNLFQETGLIS